MEKLSKFDFWIKQWDEILGARQEVLEDMKSVRERDGISEQYQDLEKEYEHLDEERDLVMVKAVFVEGPMKSQNPELAEVIGRRATDKRVQRQWAELALNNTSFEFVTEGLTTGAEYDPKSNKIRVNATQKPEVQYDNILYESCNAKRKEEQTRITDSLKDGTISMAEYGKQYCDLEFEATLEYAELIFNTPDEELPKRARRLKQNWVKKCQAEDYFKEGTPQERRAELKEKLKKGFKESPHSVEDEADPKAKMNTGEMYIYEKVEGLKSEEAMALLRAALKRVGIEEPRSGDFENGEENEEFKKKRQNFEKLVAFQRSVEYIRFLEDYPDTPALRPEAFLRLVKLVKASFPEESFPGVTECLGEACPFSESMLAVANSPLTEAAALKVLRNGGPPLEQLKLLRSSALSQSLGLEVDLGELNELIQILGTKKTDPVWKAIAKWPKSATQALLLEGLPVPKEQPSEEGGRPPVFSELLQAFSELKEKNEKNLTGKKEVLEALGTLINTLANDSATGEQLNKALESFKTQVGSLGGIKFMMIKGILNTALEKYEAKFTEAIEFLSKGK